MESQNLPIQSEPNIRSSVGTTQPTTSFRDCGVCADQNWKYRAKMEDTHYFEDKFNGNEHQGFFGVYDGHGGKEAANFAENNLHKILAENLNGVDTGNEREVNASLKKAFHETDEKMKTEVSPHHGCTAAVVFICGSQGNRHLYAANAGDARAVLSRGGKAQRLTEDHKATYEKEAQRIQESGGFIIHGRVNGQIMITRSLGDHLMKELIIGDPYISHVKLEDKDNWVIIACDGLWDVVEDQEAVDCVLENADQSAAEISKKLLVKALQKGTTDNITVMVVKL